MHQKYNKTIDKKQKLPMITKKTQSNKSQNMKNSITPLKWIPVDRRADNSIKWM